MKKTYPDKDFFRKVCEDSLTMSIAASKLGLHFNTFKRIAVEYDCYNPNMGGKGTKKFSNLIREIPLNEIIEGKHPSYQTFKLRNRLIKCGIFENCCSICKIKEWNGKSIVCELDHIDGNRTNHKIENLRMLCPNCHSQTPTFRSKKRYRD
jgi:hypothetical protein